MMDGFVMNESNATKWTLCASSQVEAQEWYCSLK